MLVVFRVGLRMLSLACALNGLIVATPDVWHTVAFYGMVGGLIGALAAASLGRGAVRGEYWLRIDRQESMNVPVVLPAIGVRAIAVSRCLGGKWVESCEWRCCCTDRAYVLLDKHQ